VIDVFAPGTNLNIEQVPPQTPTCAENCRGQGGRSASPPPSGFRYVGTRGLERGPIASPDSGRERAAASARARHKHSLVGDGEIAPVDLIDNVMRVLTLYLAAN